MTEPTEPRDYAKLEHEARGLALDAGCALEPGEDHGQTLKRLALVVAELAQRGEPVEELALEVWAHRRALALDNLRAAADAHVHADYHGGSDPGGYNDPPVPIADDLRTAAEALDGRDPSNEHTVETAQRVMREAADAIDRVAREDAAARPTVTDEETRAGIAAVEAAEADRNALNELVVLFGRGEATSPRVAAILRRVRP